MKKFMFLLYCILLTALLIGCGTVPVAPGTNTSSQVSESNSEKSTQTEEHDTDSSQGSNSDSGTSTEPEVVKTSKEILSETQHYVGLCDQLNGRVIICDLAESDWTNDNAVVWEYRHDTEGKENYGWIAGIKFRNSEYYGGDVLLFCAPRSKGYIVSMETKEVLLTAESAGANPHSVELLPNGTFIVGSSNDGLVSVYAPGESTPCYTVQLAGHNSGQPDVHGVLWDPEYETLWVTGGAKLRAFLVTGPEDSPKLSMYAEYDVPYNGIHDLAPIYGETNSLILSCTGGILKFDKDAEKFSYAYSCSSFAKTFEYIPGCGLFADGVLTFTAITEETKVYQDWDTNIVFVCVPLQGVKRDILKYKAPNDAYYKLRIFNTDYQ